MFLRTFKSTLRLILVLCLVVAQGAMAANSGDVIGTYRGVPAKSNGPDTGTGNGTWQCVEYVKRFYRDGLGISTANWSGNANTYYDASKNAQRGLMTLNNGGPYPPQADDIIAFEGGGYGHVAIITQAPSNLGPFVCSAMKIIQQNWSRDSAYATLQLTTGRGNDGRTTYTIGNQGSYRVRAWARPGNQSLAAPPAARQVSKVALTWGQIKKSD